MGRRHGPNLASPPAPPGGRCERSSRATRGRAGPPTARTGRRACAGSSRTGWSATPSSSSISVSSARIEVPRPVPTLNGPGPLDLPTPAATPPRSRRRRRSHAPGPEAPGPRSVDRRAPWPKRSRPCPVASPPGPAPDRRSRTSAGRSPGPQGRSPARARRPAWRRRRTRSGEERASRPQGPATSPYTPIEEACTISGIALPRPFRERHGRPRVGVKVTLGIVKGLLPRGLAGQVADRVIARRRQALGPPASAEIGLDELGRGRHVALDPVDRSSTTSTRQPSASSAWARWPPMKPAPPVTSARGIGRMLPFGPPVRLPEMAPRIRDGEPVVEPSPVTTDGTAISDVITEAADPARGRDSLGGRIAFGTVVQQGGQAVGLVVGLALATALARHLTLAQFGVYGLITSMATYVFFALGSAETAAIRSISAATDQPQRDRSYTTAIVVYSLLGLVAGLLIAGVGQLLLDAFHITNALRQEARIGIRRGRREPPSDSRCGCTRTCCAPTIGSRWPGPRRASVGAPSGGLCMVLLFVVHAPIWALAARRRGDPGVPRAVGAGRRPGGAAAVPPAAEPGQPRRPARVPRRVGRNVLHLIQRRPHQLARSHRAGGVSPGGDRRPVRGCRSAQQPRAGVHRVALGDTAPGELAPRRRGRPHARA